MALPSGKVSTSSGVPLSAAYCFTKPQSCARTSALSSTMAIRMAVLLSAGFRGMQRLQFPYYFPIIKESGHKIKRPVPLRAAGFSLSAR